ncbi:dTDP-4-dehydrorhamnose reductase [Barrientosiimonas humi]|uniref:dTDP-4-dehydrorhamnose reductase n=1 Tax=Barrientosiimonas humi TaxID=999931 RepID=A0A542XE66_9MICO|nr:dTDP-4-dehydrorhamnose reductase [Barrientosiimonas humi]TQL34124.1 dTDP-4-dehydrorhamnose reductase [Barrientosiimonas humi]CAG7574114.1 dTDP-4-dehydrorhamnose reductase [Barrientosiimonas humi]
MGVATKVLVTGAGGMLAHDLLPALRAAGHDVTAATRADLDVTEPAACAAAVAGHDAVINAAAWTKVDDAQDQEPAAFAVNAVGAANLARAAADSGARLVQVSTDYVFSGDATTPYAEDAPTEPRSAYGRTKLAGEWAVRALCPRSYVVRTSWLYGAGGPNFLATMVRLAGQHATLSVVDDQRGGPTWTGDLADQLVALVGSDAPFGTYHGTGAGETTWFGLTRALFTELGMDPERVEPTTTDAFPRPAPRPAYSVLGHDAWDGTGVAAQRDWRAALAEAVPQLGLTPSPGPQA